MFPEALIEVDEAEKIGAHVFKKAQKILSKATLLQHLWNFAR